MPSLDELIDGEEELGVAGDDGAVVSGADDDVLGAVLGARSIEDVGEEL